MQRRVGGEKFELPFLLLHNLKMTNGVCALLELSKLFCDGSLLWFS